MFTCFSGYVCARALELGEGGKGGDGKGGEGTRSRHSGSLMCFVFCRYFLLLKTDPPPEADCEPQIPAKYTTHFSERNC